MTTLTALRRTVSIVTGGIILAASAAAVISHTGQHGAQAVLTWMLAGGLFVGALVIGPSIDERRYALAFALVAALAAGEIANIGLSIESIIIRRETETKSTREAEAAHAYAAGELVKAEAALAKANTASIAKSAEKDCASNCRKLLEAQIKIATDDLTRARLAYGANPKPAQSATALADRVGVPGWLVDVSLAVLLAIGANGLAATLIAYGAHGATSHSIPDPDTIPADELEEARRIFSTPKNSSPAPRDLRSGREAAASRQQSPAQQVAKKNQIEAYVMTEVALGRAIPSQQSVAQRFDVAKSTVCEIMQAMERRGLISRRREGRRTIAALPAKS